MADEPYLAKFDASLILAGKLADRGDCADAITVMVPWADVELTPFHRSVLAYNLAHMFRTMGQVEEALAWFDWGIEHERGIRRTFVAAHKAAYLYELGRRDDAVRLWRELRDSGWLQDKERDSVEANLRVAGDGVPPGPRSL